jgi:hypothetical protein
LSGVQLLQLQEDSLLARSAAEESERREVLRERRLARFAAALLAPTIWLSFLGANVLPEKWLGVPVQSELFTYVGGGIALALGAGAWFLIPKLIQALDRN